MDPKDTISQMLNDLVRKGGNREATVWMAAGLGNALAKHRKDPIGATLALQGVRDFAKTLGMARRLDALVAQIDQPVCG